MSRRTVHQTALLIFIAVDGVNAGIALMRGQAFVATMAFISLGALTTVLIRVFYLQGKMLEIADRHMERTSFQGRFFYNANRYRTVDYCAKCGHSPGSGIHMFEHEYVPPKERMDA